LAIESFDVVSADFIAQTTDSWSAVSNPRNFLNPARRAQIRVTLQAAKQEGKIGYFEFTAGEPHRDVKNFIERNAARIGVSCHH
jgi:hypothetical protein